MNEICPIYGLGEGNFSLDLSKAKIFAGINRLAPNFLIRRTENPGDCAVARVILEASNLPSDGTVEQKLPCPRCGRDVHCSARLESKKPQDS